MKNPFENFIVPNFWKKFTIMFIAILLMGFFLSFLIEVGWGTDPATFMNYNLASTFNLSFGNWQMICNTLMFIVMLVFNRKLFGFGTICNWVLIGYTADFFNWLWERIGFHALIASGENFMLNLTVFVVAIACFIIVAAVYMNADMGLSPYDGIPKIISQHLPKIPYAVVRIVYDMLVILIGYVTCRFNPKGMQGSVIGSIVMAVCLGPVISFVGSFMQKHIAIFAKQEQ